MTEETTPPRRFRRRPVLGLLAATGATAVAGAVTDTGLADLLGLVLPGAPAAPALLLAVRPDDGLLVTFSFVNLDVVSGNPRKLAVHNPASDGLVVLGLGPQSLLEQGFFDAGKGVATPAQPIKALLSGPSRLVLRVAPGTPIPYDLPTLLDLARFPLSASGYAIKAAGTYPMPDHEPLPTETSIEAPFRLQLSPPDRTLFAAVKAPVTRNGRTELWHARAVGSHPDGTADLTPGARPVSAIWSQDLLRPPPPLPSWATDGGSVSLTPTDRQEIVTKTTTEAPAAASLLLVSPMGASLDVEGHWDSGLIGWKHRSWLGRDNYVKVEHAGYLFPFGFPAMRLSVTERIIQDGEAFQRIQNFIVVRRPTVGYPQDQEPKANTQPNHGRAQPFTAAATTTLVSPPLAAPIDAAPNGVLVQVLGPDGPTPLRYQLTLTAKDHRTVTADLPMLFIDDGPGESPAGITQTVTDYAKLNEDLRKLDLGGQRVAYVEPATLADHSLATTEIVLSAGLPTGPVPPKTMAAYPMLAQAKVRVEELDALGGPQGVITPLYYEPDIYLQHGFGGAENSGEVWATFKDPAAPKAAIAGPVPPGALQFALSQAAGGGMAAPKFAVDALSRVHGTITDLQNVAKNMMNPANYFDLHDIGIKLFGAIPLAAIVAPDLDPQLPTGENIPKVRTVRTADGVTTTVTWNANLRDFDGGVFKFAPGDDKKLNLTLVLTASRNGQTSSLVTGELREARLVFLDMITQPITRLHFESRDGAKPHLDIKLGIPEFNGDLQFLTSLQKFLPSMPGGISVKQTPVGVQAGMSLAVPSVGFGVVVIENLSVGVLFDLPFDGTTAKLSFSFCTREHPFHVTVMALGGGGYLSIALPMNGDLPTIEGALEFGAAVAIDLGVASGSVSIMAGIYLAVGPKPNSDGTSGPVQAVITGYIRAVGELSVLGLIHVSLEFYLGLTFIPKVGSGEGKVAGEATLKVRVEVFLFSTSVEVSMRKEIGDGIDPSFGDQISASDWATYCAAFA